MSHAAHGASADHRRPHIHDPQHDDLLARWRAERDAKNRAAFRLGAWSLLAFVVCFGAIGALWMGELESRRIAHETMVAEQAAVRAELLPNEPLTPIAAASLLRRIDGERTRWEGHPDRAAIERMAATARSIVEAEILQRQVSQTIDAAERQLDAGIVAMDLWRSMHEKLRALGHDSTPDVAERLARLEERADAGWFDALLAHAASSDAATALDDLTAASDLASCNLAHAGHDRVREQGWRMRVHTLTPRFDAAFVAATTEASIDAAAWTDVLPGTQDSDWMPNRGSEVTKQLDHDALLLRCADGPHAHPAIVSCKRPDWYAARGSLQVQVDSGRVALFCRSRREFDARRGGCILIACDGSDGYLPVPASKPVLVEWTVLGNRLTATIGGDAGQRIEQTIEHDERHGSFAVWLSPGASVRISKLRVKQLGRASAHGTQPHRS